MIFFQRYCKVISSGVVICRTERSATTNFLKILSSTFLCPWLDILGYKMLDKMSHTFFAIRILSGAAMHYHSDFQPRTIPGAQVDHKSVGQLEFLQISVWVPHLSHPFRVLRNEFKVSILYTEL